MPINRYTSSFLFMCFLLAACFTPKKISNQNSAAEYQKDASFLHPQFEVYHPGENKSFLYFKINCRELLYVKSPEKQSAGASIRIRYRLFTSYENSQVADSGSVKVIDNEYSSRGGFLLGKIEFHATYPNTYVMEVFVTDLNRNQSARSLVNVDKSGPGMRQNFMVTAVGDSMPLYRNYLGRDEKASLTLNGSTPKKELTVRYYNRSFPLPPPPFVAYNPKSFSYVADSVFTLTLENNSCTFQFPKTGFYHIQADTASREGITIYRYAEGFPAIDASDKLVGPLKYLTTKQEYEEIATSKNPKEAVDNFWLQNCGNPERAREVVKTYYTRVQNANEFFSSYQEGWKTDRGLVFTIFGPPNVINKTGISETWIYGEENSYKSLSFNFVRVINPFTDNDYSLSRNEAYKEEWYKMADMWRQGRIYNNTK
jgi:GWxTD domain-containing protein